MFLVGRNSAVILAYICSSVADLSVWMKLQSDGMYFIVISPTLSMRHMGL